MSWSNCMLFLLFNGFLLIFFFKKKIGLQCQRILQVGIHLMKNGMVTSTIMIGCFWRYNILQLPYHSSLAFLIKLLLWIKKIKKRRTHTLKSVNYACYYWIKWPNINLCPKTKSFIIYDNSGCVVMTVFCSGLSIHTDYFSIFECCKKLN